MSNINTIVVSGYVNRSSSRAISDTLRVLNFTLSVPGAGPKDPTTNKRTYGYFDVTHFNAPDWMEAAILSAPDTKGSKVYVQGTLQMESWVDKDTQKNMYKTVIISNDIDVSATKDSVPSSEESSSSSTQPVQSSPSLTDEVAALLG